MCLFSVYEQTLFSNKFVFLDRSWTMMAFNWVICDFSATAYRSLATLHRKLNVLYQVGAYRAFSSTKMAALASDWLRRLRLLSCNLLTDCNDT